MRIAPTPRLLPGVDVRFGMGAPCRLSSSGSLEAFFCDLCGVLGGFIFAVLSNTCVLSIPLTILISPSFLVLPSGLS